MYVSVLVGITWSIGKRCRKEITSGLHIWKWLQMRFRSWLEGLAVEKQRKLSSFILDKEGKKNVHMQEYLSFSRKEVESIVFYDVLALTTICCMFWKKISIPLIFSNLFCFVSFGEKIPQNYFIQSICNLAYYFSAF